VLLLIGLACDDRNQSTSTIITRWRSSLITINDTVKMSSQKSERKMFIFVEYDIKRRVVTEAARAHLMKDRIRSEHRSWHNNLTIPASSESNESTKP
jgi:hypothetical protein